MSTTTEWHHATNVTPYTVPAMHYLDGTPVTDDYPDATEDDGEEYEDAVPAGRVAVVLDNPGNCTAAALVGTEDELRTLLRAALDALDAMGDATTDPEDAYAHAAQLRERAGDAQKVESDLWDAYHRAALRAFILAQPGEPWTDDTATVPVPVLHDEDGTYLYGDPDEGDALDACELLHLIPARSLPEHVGTYDNGTDTYLINARAAVFGPTPEG